MVQVSEYEQENERVEESRVGINPTQTDHEQEEQLRQIMDDDMGNALVRKPETNANMSKDEVSDATGGEHTQNSSQVGQAQNQSKTSPAARLTSSGGRRRGKRKFLKKKTFKDEEGYLGMRPLCHTRVYATKSRLQLRRKSHHGNRSRKMSQ